MSRWRRLFRYGRWGALLGFGLLAMVYTHFAFMPTGYEKFEKKHLDAPRRIENVVALPTRPATQRGENAGEESKTEDQGSETPPVEEHPVDLAVGLERFGSTWGGLWREFSPANFPTTYMRELSCRFPVEGVRSNPSPSVLTEDPRFGRRIITEVFFNELRNRQRRDSSSRARPTPQSNPKFKEELHAALDEAEDFLLRTSWKVPAFIDVEEAGVGLRFLAGLAILRAGLRGEQHKAADLLESYLRVLRIIYLSEPRFYANQSLHWMLDNLCLVEESGALSDEGLSRVVDFINNFEPNEEELDKAIIARTLSARNYSMRRLYDENAGVQSALHLYSWFTWPVFRPIVARQIDSAAMSVASGDKRRIRATKRNLSITREIMDLLNVSRAPISEMQQCLGEEYALTENKDLDCARLYLAALRYHEANGQYPSSIEEMKPDFLDPSFDASHWALFRFDSGMYPVFDPESESDPLANAVKRYWIENGVLPHSPDDLLSFASDQSEVEQFQDRFEWFKENPVFCYFDFRGSPYLILHRLNWLAPPTRQDEREVEQRQGGNQQVLYYFLGRFIAHVTFSHPEFQSNSSELAELLSGVDL